MSEIRVNAVKNTSGVERYLAQAWVRFNGSGLPVAILASGGVSSVVDNGVADYTVNFTNAFADYNYSTVVSVEPPSNTFTPAGGQVRYAGQQAGYARLSTWAAVNGGVSPVLADASTVGAAFFR